MSGIILQKLLAKPQLTTQSSIFVPQHARNINICHSPKSSIRISNKVQLGVAESVFDQHSYRIVIIIMQAGVRKGSGAKCYLGVVGF